MSDLEAHATAIRTAIRETAEAVARTDMGDYTQRKENAVLLAHLQRLQDLENAVLSMVSVQVKGEE